MHLPPHTKPSRRKTVRCRARWRPSGARRQRRNARERRTALRARLEDRRTAADSSARRAAERVAALEAEAEAHAKRNRDVQTLVTRAEERAASAEQARQDAVAQLTEAECVARDAAAAAARWCNDAGVSAATARAMEEAALAAKEGSAAAERRADEASATTAAAGEKLVRCQDELQQARGRHEAVWFQLVC